MDGWACLTGNLWLCVAGAWSVDHRLLWWMHSPLRKFTVNQGLLTSSTNWTLWWAGSHPVWEINTLMLHSWLTQPTAPRAAQSCCFKINSSLKCHENFRSRFFSKGYSKNNFIPIEIICSVLYSILVKLVSSIYKYGSKMSRWLI